MSKIALSSNASGTGTFTLASPNSNTDRTLTLPDATGTLALSGGAVTGTTADFSSTIKGGATISVGGATPSTSGSGITFPATQSASSDANTLDDYEEGTWTPTFIPGSGTITSYSVQNGRYTKIGNQVIVFGEVRANNIGTAAGSMRISGLPFTSLSTSFFSYATATGTVVEVLATGFSYYSQVNTNSTNFYVYKADYTNAPFNNTYCYAFTIVYEAA